MIKEILRKLIDGQDLTAREARSAVEEIMSGRTTPAQTAAFLTALRMKGETPEEIFACASAMREKAVRIKVPAGAVDTCGTGGDGKGTANISTMSAFIAAGAGVTVAKHGNRALSSASGSADVLEALGVKIDMPPERVEACIRKVGIGFLFAPVFHKAMKHAVGPRREIGFRTVFNLLGPLTNPAGVKRQVVGVYSPRLVGTVAEVLSLFGVERAVVVHGSGTDEISISGPTDVAVVEKDEIRRFTLTPEEMMVERRPLSSVKGGGPQDNAEIMRKVLRGEEGPMLDVALLNAAAAVFAGGKVGDLSEGMKTAREAVSSGAAEEKLEELIRFSASS